MNGPNIAAKTKIIVIVVPIAVTGWEKSFRSTRDKRRHLDGATLDTIGVVSGTELTIIAEPGGLLTNRNVREMASSENR